MCFRFPGLALSSLDSADARSKQKLAAIARDGLLLTQRTATVAAWRPEVARRHLLSQDLDYDSTASQDPLGGEFAVATFHES
jgi:hypothetical protein